jgi:glycosyltransferase involved in cell wall biosynthesis
VNSGHAAGTVVVVTNLYPPHYLGGYELACADVVESLLARGWDVRVLTSRFRAETDDTDARVERSLYVRLPGAGAATWPLHELLHHIENRRLLRRSLARNRPDVVLAFNLSGLGGPLLDRLHRQPRPVVHDVSDASLAFRFANDVWFERIVRPAPGSRRLLARTAVRIAFRAILPALPCEIDLSDSYFRSNYLRQHFVQAGFPVGAAPVIHHGIRAELLARPRDAAAGRGVVFSGRISPEKGVTVLVRAMELASTRVSPEHRRLTIIGPVADSEYGRKVQRTVGRATDVCRVDLLGQMTRDEALRVLPQHAAFAFPVLWDEPFSIALLEAMALEMPIVATMTGGTPEILQDGRNGLAVPPGDAERMADALVRLLGDDPFRRALAAAARASASRHIIDQTFETIESHLVRTLSKHRQRRSP